MKRVYYIGNQMFTRLEHFYTKEVIPAVDVHEVKDTREESLEVASDLQEEPKQEEQTQVNKIKFTDANGNENVLEKMVDVLLQRVQQALELLKLLVLNMMVKLAY